MQSAKECQKIYHLIKGSLAYHKQRPFMKPRDISGYSLADTVAQMVLFEDGATMAVPEVEAVSFYLLNDAFAQLCAKFDANEPLPVEANTIAESYVVHSQLRALRLFYYCLLIVTRESRHLYANSWYNNQLEKEHGHAFYDFMHKLNSISEDAAVNRLRKQPPNITLGEYTKGMVAVFEKGGFGGSFGGEPWADVARTLDRAVHGDTSMEAFIDAGWALAHNNGPIFNKGMLYEMYSLPQLSKILDVQRSGQIPQMVEESCVPKASIPAIKALYTMCEKVLPDFGAPGYVDWFKVEALGSEKKYPKEKTAQQEKYGPSPALEAAPIAAAKKVFHVMPGVTVDIVERKLKKVAA